MLWEEKKKRKPFSTKTKKIEWMIAANQKVYDKSGKLRFVSKSKCRVCKRPLTWGDRTYDFDHKDNNPANNSQRNCFLVCKVCHGKHTVVKKRRITGFFGETVGHKTIKKKVGYKKPKKKPKKTRRVAIRNVFGEVTGYRTVKIRKPKTTKKKPTTRKTKKRTTSSKKTTKPKRTSGKKKTTRRTTRTKRRRRKKE